MPELQPSHSAPTPSSGPRARLPRRQSDSASSLHLQPVFSAQHLDDVSDYHDGDHQSKHHDADNDTDYSSELEHVRNDDYDEAAREGKDEVAEVRMGILDTRDLEANLEKKQTTRSIKDPNLVSWDSPDDPENPKNWTFGRKWAATIVVSSFTLISPVSSSMVAPALTSISKEFGITNEVESQLVLSVFVLAYAIGPLFLGPLSEIYGRVPVLQLSNLVYLVFNIACGASRNKGEMIAFRFLSGLGGSAPLAGPIAGGFITQNTTWRWAFWATSIADGAIQVMGLLFLKETYPPKLLHAKAEKLRKDTGNAALHTEFEHPERTLANTMKRSLIRPFKLLGTQPIVQALAMYMAYLYGLMYLVLSTFPALWEKQYHESIGIGGLNYISLGVGFFLGTQICAPVNDRIYRRLKKRNDNVGRPEFRIPLMIPGSLLVPIGLFIYGWSSQYHTHWIGPNIGAALFAAGVIIGFQCIQTYLVDSYTRFAASAIAAATVLRSLAGFGFPLFAPSMYDALHYGWGNSLLGFIAIGLGVPAPFLLWFFGRKLRERSPFAAGGD
ncbi:MAG: hypothetical protein ALECFALPRED_003017 [Alectoria fallacina]|uniref:Major facilitator superfamily (MFS) profile domain-containing protein n=1 Tax=Alectoria fallacina TaxID=1903189 RepID=A0A8H3I1Q0_9LECA|nr:MAG: hypothetical protein ALECFALPRED_003017 [Alectoria fallacina]